MPLTSEQGEAVRRLDENLCVVAGAGTGKTLVLVERYLALLAEGELEPADIAAITFTEKAAAEMRTKLREACAVRARGARTADERRQWQERRDRLAAAAISTIHGFCNQLIQQRPVEAGVDPGSAVVTGPERDRLVADAVQATLRRLLGEGDADVLVAARSYRLATLMGILGDLVRNRPATFRAAESLDVGRDAILERLREAVEAAAGEAIDASFAAEPVRKAAGLVAAVAGKEGDLAESSRQQAVEALAMTSPGNPPGTRLDGLRALLAIKLRGGSEKNWASKELLGEVKDAVRTVRDAAKDALAACDVCDADQWPAQVDLGRSLLSVAMAAIDEYQRAKADRGQVDYDDQLLKSRDLLLSHAEARRSLASRFRAVLVDELQDTDPLQAEVLALLLGDGRGGEFAPRPGTFFGVGDVKQSIYRFRGADVGVFRSIAATHEPGAVVRLTKTFRFHQGLAGATNAVFEKLLGEDFAPLMADREDRPPVSLEVILAASDGEANTEEYRFLEAARVAQRIRRLADEEGVPYGDVAILMHRGTQSYPYEDALARLGVPFHLVGGRRFYEQDEIRDVATALRAVRNPGDGLALASLLRSPFFGISDDALYALCRAGPLEEAVRDAGAMAGLDASDREKASRAARWLDHFSARAGRIGVARLVEEIVFEGLPDGSQGGMAHVVLSQFLGERRYANLRRLVEKARQSDLTGHVRLEDFLETLETGIQDAVEEAEAPLTEEGKDVVLMMTVHRAKGLEFPYVLLINADAGRSSPQQAFYADAGLGLAPRRPDRLSGAVEPAAYTLLRARDFREELAEFRRLFYVAATRARERLMISGSQSTSHTARNSWLRWLGEAVGTDLFAERVGSHTMELAPGSRMLIDVARAERLSLRPGRKSGAVDALFSGGLVDTSALDKLTKRKVSRATAESFEPAVASVAEDTSRLWLPVTALADYARCPARFRLHHVMGLRGLALRAGAKGRPAGPDTAAVGEVVHQCLRDLDLARQSVDEVHVRRVVAGSARIAVADREIVARAAAELLGRFLRMPLAAQLQSASRVYRETPFVLDCAGASLSGVLDLLFEYANGWTLVDYKTDRIAADAVEDNARHYMMQLCVYHRAASAFLQTDIKHTCLVFLVPGIIWYMARPLSDGILEETIEDIRRGRFEPLPGCHERCDVALVCPQQRQKGEV